MIKDFKFSSDDFKGYSIEELPDDPSNAGIGPEELKKRFDAIPKLVIALGKINSFLNWLETSVAYTDIGAKKLNGTDGKLSDVIAELKSLSDQLAGTGRTTETIKDTYDKLQELSANLLAENGASLVGMSKLYPDDKTGETVKEKLLHLMELVQKIDKFTPRGIADRLEDLPLTGNAYGDFFYVKTTDPNIFREYVWIQSAPDQWQYFGDVSNYVLSNYYTKSETYTKTETDAKFTIVDEQLTNHEAKTSSLTQSGHIKLNSATNSTDETTASTPKAIKEVMDLANLKGEYVFGSYTGNNSTQNITLGFRPKAVIISTRFITMDTVTNGVFAFALDGFPSLAKNGNYDALTITATGFTVGYDANTSTGGFSPYRYIAFK